MFFINFCLYFIIHYLRFHRILLDCGNRFHVSLITTAVRVHLAPLLQDGDAFANCLRLLDGHILIFFKKSKFFIETNK